MALSIIGTMTDLGFEDTLIQQVAGVLDQSTKAVRDAREVRGVAPTSFGDIQEGIDLADHTQRARDRVRVALDEMVAGLAGYHSALLQLREDTYQVEDDTVTTLQRIAQAESCVVTPSFAAPSQCAAPGTSEG
ncbi:hypothetical protein [Nocardioides dongkuii]|uniref:hypothetical protein n=1 Tax=Nocardioides dongkuii TaxID=2760089 RepID=UPI0015FDB85E|nr:hypothetical protein [Nocardioides dongkuii]